MAGCRRPHKLGKRFCNVHSHLEPKCAVFRPKVAECVALPAQPSLRQLINAYMKFGPHSIVMGDRCDRDAEPGSLTCGDGLCQAIIHNLRHAPQVDDVLPNDQSKNDKKERVLSWQKIHAKQWVACNALIGFFFFVCPCGVSPPSIHYSCRPNLLLLPYVV